MIAGGLRETVNDYLDDVVDGAQGPELVLRSGQRIPVQQGSVFINCTGHLVRRAHPYEPFLSQRGAILSINPHSVIHYLSSVSSYFLSHMFFLAKLDTTPLYEFDAEGTFAKNSRMCHTAVMTVSFMNIILLLKVLPIRAFNQCGLDLDRLFPLPRRAKAIANIKLHGWRYLAHCRKALDRVREIYGVHCGPLVAAASPAVSADPDVRSYGFSPDLQRTG